MSEVLIVGGGIAGLTLALELHAVGRSCSVFEKMPRIGPLGVGINLQPYAVSHLARLGLLPALRSLSLSPERCIYASRLGQILFEDKIGIAARQPQPQLSLPREALHNLLLKSVRSRLGASAVVFGKDFTGFSQSRNDITAHFGDGNTETGNILVACDGVHSKSFSQMHPDKEPVRCSSITMWRGLTPDMRLLDGRTMLRAGTLSEGKLVVYPIRSTDTDAIMLNWVVEKQMLNNEAASVAAPSVQDFRSFFEHWERSWLDVDRLFETSRPILRRPMSDRDPCPFWVQGRAALLGDAAHPMYPVGSNGAGQAVLDAATLAQCLDKAPNPMDALRHYQNIRKPAAEQIVRSDRNGGPDVVLMAIEALSRGNQVDDIKAREFRTEAHGLLAGYRSRVDTAHAAVPIH